MVEKNSDDINLNLIISINFHALYDLVIEFPYCIFLPPTFNDNNYNFLKHNSLHCYKMFHYKYAIKCGARWSFSAS